jgi:hypothetical protein
MPYDELLKSVKNHDYFMKVGMSDEGAMEIAENHGLEPERVDSNHFVLREGPYNEFIEALDKKDMSSFEYMKVMTKKPEMVEEYLEDNSELEKRNRYSHEHGSTIVVGRV